MKKNIILLIIIALAVVWMPFIGYHLFGSIATYILGESAFTAKSQEFLSPFKFMGGMTGYICWMLSMNTLYDRACTIMDEIRDSL